MAEPESLTPPPSFDLGEKSRPAVSPKQHRASLAKRLSGRPALMSSTSSVGSLENLAPASKIESQNTESSATKTKCAQEHHHSRHSRSSHIISQVRHWLHEEKARKAARQHRSRDAASRLSSATHAASALVDEAYGKGPTHFSARHRRSSSVSSEGLLALERLEQILTASTGFSTDTTRDDKTGPYFSRRGSRLLRKQSTIASSDTEYHDIESYVPSADVVLDNSKTLGYCGGAASQTDLPQHSQQAKKEMEAWLQFKYEIVRLSHTLKLPRWRRVHLDRSGDIAVERLSGALTNAVYVVSPPIDLPPPTSDPRSSTSSLAAMVKRPPPKLLLRIYGPRVEHLIDRESELQILRRLARRNIGPKMLGTFTNGRFEQFFNARTLTAQDLRVPETSKQIAKRMRELHDGIDLLDEERDRGPFIWQNWDKWVQRCEEVISQLDQQVLLRDQKSGPRRAEVFGKSGLVCGVEWSIFRQTVDRYRQWLDEQHGGPGGVREHLVFAHNDTQYGNLLRLQPSGESPLLTPANEHKQLVVIDFEYASANVPGLEFANHFVISRLLFWRSRANLYQTEWCYNYHDAERSHALDHDRYPTLGEQKRFLKAYVQHRPHLQHSSPRLTAATTPGPTSSISSFMLDSRGQPSQYREEELRREEATEAEIRRLLHQTRLWRVANSAQWVAWGIVQAKVPVSRKASLAQNERGLHTLEGTSGTHEQGNMTLPASDTLILEATSSAQGPYGERPEGLAAESFTNGADIPDNDGDDEEEDDDEFDYLAYARDRAMFFWGDVLQLGIVQREDLPAELLENVKIVEY
ncbi:MAG: hypothetical protein Q9195_004243 [Heterodermia aff. obscurata]